MDVQEHTKPENMLRYSFLWNEARLVIAAISLLWGATPVLSRFMSSSGYGIYVICSVISGVVGVYLLYLWNKAGRKLFGGNDRKDLIAFMIATLSGVHLGLGGLLGTNIAMSIIGYSGLLFTLAVIVTGLLYLWSAWHLWQQYKTHGEKLF